MYVNRIFSLSTGKYLKEEKNRPSQVLTSLFFTFKIICITLSNLIITVENIFNSKVIYLTVYIPTK